METKANVGVYLDPQLAKYGFGPNHPFNNDRFAAFAETFHRLHLDQKVQLLTGRMATPEEIQQFHTPDYIAWVKQKSDEGVGFLDYGDTPVVPGIYEAAAYVVGTVLDAVEQIMKGDIKKAFVPVAGLHHAHPHSASGFCVFNDCAIAIQTLRQTYGIQKIAYIDIDVHHGDGVFYGFENDPNLIDADIHQEGIFPGTGAPFETGVGQSSGKKLNLSLPGGAGDDAFFEVWPQVEALLEREKPEFIILQCGADSLGGDPLASLQYSERPHKYAATRLCKVADQYSQGRFLALGGGGYNLENIGRAWTAVVEAMVEGAGFEPA